MKQINLLFNAQVKNPGPFGNMPTAMMNTAPYLMLFFVSAVAARSTAYPATAMRLKIMIQMPRRRVLSLAKATMMAKTEAQAYGGFGMFIRFNRLNRRKQIGAYHGAKLGLDGLVAHVPEDGRHEDGDALHPDVDGKETKSADDVVDVEEGAVDGFHGNRLVRVLRDVSN